MERSSTDMVRAACQPGFWSPLLWLWFELVCLGRLSRNWEQLLSRDSCSCSHLLASPVPPAAGDAADVRISSLENQSGLLFHQYNQHLRMWLRVCYSGEDLTWVHLRWDLKKQIWTFVNNKWRNLCRWAWTPFVLLIRAIEKTAVIFNFCVSWSVKFVPWHKNWLCISFPIFLQVLL